MAIFVDRKEDMSADGYLRLCIEDDGDVIVMVNQYDERTKEFICAEVQFCTYSGGGRSSRVFKALRALAVAMAEENADPMANCSGRNEYHGAELSAT